MNRDFVKIAVSNGRNIIAEELYLKWGVDVTRPVQVHAMINTKCNARCLMCNSWRRDAAIELPASNWILALKSLKALSGNFHINFSGGEPLLKKDFFEVLEFCSKEKIIVGFTTNGLLLNKGNVDRILGINVANINISLDSVDENIHDTMRGVPGILKKVMANIEYLMKEREMLNSNIRIVLKPTVNSYNIDDLESIVSYSQDMKLTGVHFQPIFKWNEEAEKMFHFPEEKLSRAISRLIDMKNEGYNILNSIESIQMWPNHFYGGIPSQNSPCKVSLRSLNIFANGDILLCPLCESKIGNIAQDDINNIWRSDSTKKLRKKLVGCKKTCLATCVVKRNWMDYLNLFIRFAKG